MLRKMPAGLAGAYQRITSPREPSSYGTGDDDRGAGTMIAFDQLLDGVRVDVEPLAGHDGQSATVHGLPGGVFVVRLACGATIRIASDSVTIVPARRATPVLARGISAVGGLATAALRIRATCEGAVNLFDKLGEPLVLPLGVHDPLRQCVEDLKEEIDTAR